MLKALPCASRSCRTATLPDGGVYALATPPGPRGLRYRCSKCRQFNSLTAPEFHRLAAMTFEDLRACGLADVIRQDIPGLSMYQLEQVHAAGVPLGALHKPAEQE